MSEYPGKGKVAVLKTSPDTVLEDIERLMKLAELNRPCLKTFKRVLRSISPGRPGTPPVHRRPGS